MDPWNAIYRNNVWSYSLGCVNAHMLKNDPIWGVMWKSLLKNVDNLQSQISDISLEEKKEINQWFSKRMLTLFYANGDWLISKRSMNKLRLEYLDKNDRDYIKAIDELKDDEEQKSRPLRKYIKDVNNDLKVLETAISKTPGVSGDILQTIRDVKSKLPSQYPYNFKTLPIDLQNSYESIDSLKDQLSHSNSTESDKKIKNEVIALRTSLNHAYKRIDTSDIGIKNLFEWVESERKNNDKDIMRSVLKVTQVMDELRSSTNGDSTPSQLAEAA